MKKLAIFLAIVMVLSCLTVFVSAESDPECDLRPVDADAANAKVEIDGATVETNSVGTATITLTAAVATIKVIYKDAAGTYEELRANIKDEQKYIRYFIDYGEGITKLEVHGHYKRGDKDDADLYLSGMEANPGYYKLGGTAVIEGPGATYGVWDISKYLGDRESKGYIPADGCIEFHDNEFRIEGAVGSVLTVYYYDLADSYDDDFGTVIPDDNVIDLSGDESEPAGDDESEPAGGDESEPAGGDESEPAGGDESEPAGGDESEPETTDYSKYNFLKTASGTGVNTSVAGESIRVFTPGFNMADSNTRWSINVLLKEVKEGQFEVVSVETGKGDNYAEAIPEGHVLLAVHSSSSKPEEIAQYQNVNGKLAAMDLEPGDKIVLEYNADVITKAARVKRFPSTPTTGDAGVIALAIVSVIALGGAVIVKKSK